jgi:AsmA protein
MSKFVKIVAGLIVVVVVLVAGGLAAVAALFNPNDFKPQIVKAAKDATGRDLKLEGDLALTYFPWLGVKTGGIELANAPGFGDAPMLKLAGAEVSVKLLPLLSRQVEMDRLKVRGLVFHYAKAKDGRSNLDDLTGAGGAKSDGGGAPPVAALAIGGVDIEEAVISVDDRQAGRSFKLEQVTVRTGAIQPGKPVDLRAGFNFASKAPEAAGRFQVAGVVTADPEAARYAIAGLTLELEAKGKGVPGGETKASLKGELAADLKAGTFAIKDMNGKLLGGDIKLALNASGLNAGPKAEGSLVVSNMDVARLAKAGGAEVKEAGPGSANLNFQYDAVAQTFAARDLKVDFAGLKLAGQVHGTGIGGPKAALSGQVDVSPFNPKALLATLGQAPPAFSDPKALTHARASFNISGTPQRVRLDNLKAELDQSKISGSLSAGKDGGFGFDLNVDRINADQYNPAPGGGSAPAAGAGGGKGGSAAVSGPLLPVPVLKALNGEGTLRIGQAQRMNLKLSNVSVTLKAQGGLVKLEPVTAELYGGRLHTVAQADVRGATPRIQHSLKLTGVQIEPLMTDLNGKSKIKGRADIEANVSAQAQDMQGLKRSLNGTARFGFFDGAVKGIDIAGVLRNFKSALKGNFAQTSDSQSTDFAAVTGTATITSGVVENRDLDGKSPLLRVNGGGQADIAAETINYSVKAELVASSKGQGGRGAEDLTGIPVPVKITGTFSDPKYEFDTAAALEGVLKNKLTEKLEDKLKGKLPGVGGGSGGSGGGKSPLDKLKKLF